MSASTGRQGRLPTNGALDDQPPSAIREQADLTGTKHGCEIPQCGLQRARGWVAIRSCAMSVAAVAGKKITRGLLFEAPAVRP